MAKPDGRIEKGQRLSTAISARAWNRAQDAADIVLGVRPGLQAGQGKPYQYSLVVPIGVTAPNFNYQGGVGIPIKITECGVQSDLYAGISFIRGEVAAATTINTTQLPVPEFFAVSVEPVPSAGGFVRCAIKGLCIARVRRYAPTDKYVALPTRRSSEEDPADLNGTLESSAAGYGRLVVAIDDDYSLISI